MSFAWAPPPTSPQCRTPPPVSHRGYTRFWKSLIYGGLTWWDSHNCLIDDGRCNDGPTLIGGVYHRYHRCHRCHWHTDCGCGQRVDIGIVAVALGHHRGVVRVAEAVEAPCGALHVGRGLIHRRRIIYKPGSSMMFRIRTHILMSSLSGGGSC